MDVTSNRMHGVSPAPIRQYEGNPNTTGEPPAETELYTQLSNVGAGNPGPTANLRGIEANTSRTGNTMAPSAAAGSDQNIPSVTEIPGYCPPFTPPSSAGNTAGGGRDSFDEFGEHYPGNPMGVNDGPY